MENIGVRLKTFLIAGGRHFMKDITFIELDVLMALTVINVAVVYDVTPCSLYVSGERNRILLHVPPSHFSTVKI
jgi:hypothetical protein